MIKSVNDTTFKQEVLNYALPVLVYFWGDDCNPCRNLIKDIELVDIDHCIEFKIVKIKLQDSQETFARYFVRSIPTLKIFKDGVVYETAIGLQSKIQIEKMIKPYLQVAL